MAASAAPHSPCPCVQYSTNQHPLSHQILIIGCCGKTKHEPTTETHEPNSDGQTSFSIHLGHGSFILMFKSNFKINFRPIYTLHNSTPWIFLLPIFIVLCIEKLCVVDWLWVVRQMEPTTTNLSQSLTAVKEAVFWVSMNMRHVPVLSI